LIFYSLGVKYSTSFAEGTPLKMSDNQKKGKMRARAKNPTGRQKRISIQEARKYFRKKNHNASPTAFWKSTGTEQ